MLDGLRETWEPHATQTMVNAAIAAKAAKAALPASRAGSAAQAAASAAPAAGAGAHGAAKAPDFVGGLRGACAHTNSPNCSTAPREGAWTIPPTSGIFMFSS